MIRKLSFATALAAALILGGCFGDSTPEEMLNTIEELQSKNYPMNEKQQADVAGFVAKGKEAMAAGQKDAAMTAFEEAIAVLKYAESAAVYNKAD